MFSLKSMTKLEDLTVLFTSLFVLSKRCSSLKSNGKSEEEY
jgi:hypothetical protein